MPLFHLVYVSSATAPFSDADLLELLKRSRANNTAIHITGMLLYEGGNFMQVLEGDKSAVEKVHARISRDPRHRGLMTLLKGEIPQRSFSDWSMGFRKIDPKEAAQLAGYSEFMNLDWRGTEMLANPGKALKLLAVFRDSMR